MLEERFRLMYLSKDGTGIKQISLSWKKFWFIVSLFTILFSGIIVVIVGTTTRLFHSYRIASLTNDREHLQKDLLSIKQRVATLSDRLAQIEISSDELRNVANLEPINNDVRQVGVGGPSYGSFDFAYYPDEVNRTAYEIKLDLDKLERAVQLEKHSMNEITAKLRTQKDQISRFPSIMPILGGRINSKFGWRSDPFTNKKTFHYGIDIAMPNGTKILSTAFGRVESVKKSKTYGNYVVVEHGYGYRTLYAHCSKILVKKGDRVKRWQALAEVGKTGRAEGYHLHYEVRYDNEKKNPELYIYN